QHMVRSRRLTMTAMMTPTTYIEKREITCLQRDTEESDDEIRCFVGALPYSHENKKENEDRSTHVENRTEFHGIPDGEETDDIVEHP
ncbi:hypothetical protein PMAYCL1PPCAC_07753, partial [Pristionchus mayeri]